MAVCVMCWNKPAARAANGRPTVFCSPECAAEFKRVNRDKPYGMGAEEWGRQQKQKAEIDAAIRTVLTGTKAAAREARQALRLKWGIRAFYNPVAGVEVRL